MQNQQAPDPRTYIIPVMIAAGCAVDVLERSWKDAAASTRDFNRLAASVWQAGFRMELPLLNAAGADVPEKPTRAAHLVIGTLLNTARALSYAQDNGGEIDDIEQAFYDLANALYYTGALDALSLSPGLDAEKAAINSAFNQYSNGARDRIAAANDKNEIPFALADLKRALG
jgi:hypothetical protein